MIYMYRGKESNPSFPFPCIYVRCADGYQAPVDVDVHEWYTARGDVGSTVGEWTSLLGEDLVVLDVPGHHFEMFHSSRARTFHCLVTSVPI